FFASLKPERCVRSIYLFSKILHMNTLPEFIKAYSGLLMSDPGPSQDKSDKSRKM
ncbi:hypothetical protein KI387_006036, partial [Taxus chinensis]